MIAEAGARTGAPASKSQTENNAKTEKNGKTETTPKPKTQYTSILPVGRGL